jgi:hypothetical protein
MMTPFAYYLRTIPLQPLQSALSAQERGRSEWCRWAADHCRSKVVPLVTVHLLQAARPEGRGACQCQEPCTQHACPECTAPSQVQVLINN